MRITFLGATGTVTGSKYLIEAAGKRIMVDCGMYQGLKKLRLRNWETPSINPASIDAVIFTHAHIDHTGYLPRFAKLGFKGKVYATPATADLCDILLPDSAHIAEEEAERANRYGYSKHHPALPLYTIEEAENALKLIQAVPFGKITQLAPGFHFQFHHAGHILGASFVHLECEGTSLLFSGDMGRFDDPVMRAPATIEKIDYLVLESTYGDRAHSDTDPMMQLAEIVNKTAEQMGNIIIPAFAVGRAQNILYYLYQLKQARLIPDIPVFLDSPMAISATNLFCKYHNEHHLSKEHCAKVCDSATYIRSVEESKELDRHPAPMIIISASGMASGGRVLHHLKKFAPDPNNAIVLTGYQAAGTRGARIQNGEPVVKMLGEMVPINAHIYNLENTSAHADQTEILNWCSQFSSPPRKVFLTHGEPHSSQGLQQKLTEKLGWNVIIPSYEQSEDL